MITVTARINISENGGTISSVSGDDFGNNVSSSISSVLNNKNTNIENPFILSKSKLDDGSYFVDSLSYFMSAQSSDSYGNFQSPYTITISGENIKHAIIVFDKDNGAHPNSLLVDGVSYADDDAQFELVFDSASSTHTVTISNWNKPNSPLIITSIYADINIDIDRRNLVSFDGSIMDRESAEYPSYGIISNSASLTFMDYNEQALDLIQQKILHSGISISITLNNTTTNTQEPIALTQIRELSYDNDNRQVNLTLKDNLEDWQEINVEAVPYDFDNQGAKPFVALYNRLLMYADLAGFDVQNTAELDEETRSILENTTIEYFFVESGTLWDCWQKLCEALHLHIYMNENGKVVCKYKI